MKSILQEFKDINHKILHSVNKNALTPIETYLVKLKNTYMKDNRISKNVKKMVIRNYKNSMKLIEKMKRRLQ
jgi:hypothetical protein